MAGGGRGAGKVGEYSVRRDHGRKDRGDISNTMEYGKELHGGRRRYNTINKNVSKVDGKALLRLSYWEPSSLNMGWAGQLLG